MAWYDQLITDIKGLATAVAIDVKAILPRLIPAGGTAGQLLAKLSGSDYAVGWITPAGGSWTTITPTVAGGLVTVALGTNNPSFCPILTAAATTVNVTGTGSQTVRLRIKLGGAHSLAFQYNGIAASVKWIGNQTPPFGLVTNSVYILEGFADGTVLEFDNYYQRE